MRRTESSSPVHLSRRDHPPGWGHRSRPEGAGLCPSPPTTRRGPASQTLWRKLWPRLRAALRLWNDDSAAHGVGSQTARTSRRSVNPRRGLPAKAWRSTVASIPAG